MLPLSHTYISTKVIGKESELLVFGSILPDIAHISAGRIDRIKIHESPQLFYDFVRINFPDLADLAFGVKLHSPIGKGADWYSDDDNEGFAKIEGKKIAKESGQLWKVTDEKESIVLAHNFIEASIDLNLLSSHPEILSLYRRSMTNLDVDKISICLSKYLKMDKDKVYSELNNLIYFFSPDNLSSAENMAKNLIIPWREIFYGIRADYQQTLQVLKSAQEITKDKYSNFLNEVANKMKLDFEYCGQT